MDEFAQSLQASQASQKARAASLTVPDVLDWKAFDGMSSKDIESIMEQYARKCGVKQPDFEYMYSNLCEEFSDEDGNRPEGKAWPSMGSEDPQLEHYGELARYVVQETQSMLERQEQETIEKNSNLVDEIPTDVWLQIARSLTVKEMATMRWLRRSVRDAADFVLGELIQTLVNNTDGIQGGDGYLLTDLSTPSKYQLLSEGCCRAAVHPAVRSVMASMRRVNVGSQLYFQHTYHKNVKVIWNQKRTLFAVCHSPDPAIQATADEAAGQLERTSNLSNIDPAISVFCAKTHKEIASARLRHLYKIRATESLWPDHMMARANDCTAFSATGDAILFGATTEIVIWSFKQWPFISQDTPESKAMREDYRLNAADPFSAFYRDDNDLILKRITSLETFPGELYLKFTTEKQPLGMPLSQDTWIVALTVGATDAIKIKTESSYGAPTGDWEEPATPFSSNTSGVYLFTNTPHEASFCISGWERSSEHPFDPVCRRKKAICEYNGWDGDLRVYHSGKIFSGFPCDIDPFSIQGSHCGNLVTMLDAGHKSLALSYAGPQTNMNGDLGYMGKCSHQNLHLFRFPLRVESAFFTDTGAGCPCLVTLMPPDYEGLQCSAFDCKNMTADSREGRPVRNTLCRYTVGRLLDDILRESRSLFAPAPARFNHGCDEPDCGWTDPSLAKLDAGGAFVILRKENSLASFRNLWDIRFLEGNGPYDSVSRFCERTEYLRDRQTPLRFTTRRMRSGDTPGY